MKTFASRMAALLLAAASASAADMTFTPATGGGVTIQSAPGAPALQVLPTGGVRLPGLPAAPTAGGAVCHDAAGTLGRCDPQAGAGQKGDKGDPGDAGAQGPVGPTGPTGAAGPRGDAGATGATGARGPAGAAGADGLQGPAGPTGATGPRGDKGDKGDTGSTGPQGPAGPQGSVAGVAYMRHGCFRVTYLTSDPLRPVSRIGGNGYTVNPATDPGDNQKRVYFILFDAPPGGLDSTVLLDVRAASGRGLPTSVQRGNPIHLLLKVDVSSVQEGEEYDICFTLMR
jgi:hypothetical protein